MVRRVELEALAPFDWKRAEQARRPRESEYDTIYHEPLDLYVGGKRAVIVRSIAEADYADLLASLKRLHYGEHQRLRGMTTRSVVFGYLPRLAVRHDWCSACALAREQPEEHATLCKWAEWVSGEFATLAPDEYAAHLTRIEKVAAEWRLARSVFTSGICNDRAALAYHKDAGNFTGSWSWMLVFQRDTDGGELVVPEMRAAFDFEGAWLIGFDGARRPHGVHPMHLRSKAAFRYSVVYYALKGMAQCGTRAEELARIRKLKTERARSRLLAPDELKRRIRG